MSELSVVIIIPVKYFNPNLKRAIEECLKLDYKRFEILVFPDICGPEFRQFGNKIKVVPTGNMGPALKRDLALEHSNADLFAFLDDDAFPEPQWLNNAVGHFNDEDVAAVGGPSVTPPNSTFAQMCSGYAFDSAVVSGPYTYRYVPAGKVMYVDDYPSCNFIIRREIFEKLGGFDSSFYPGEDTKLCLEITKKLNKKIVYDPAVLVYHHRRDSFTGHRKQVANYAVHRGNFAKRYPETSRKPVYFIPSVFFGAIVIGALSALLDYRSRVIYLVCCFFYFLIVGINVAWVMSKDKYHSFGYKVILFLPSVVNIFITHLTYGVFFLKGLISKKLKEEKR